MTVGRKCTCPSSSNGCENNNTQAESRVDTKTTGTGCATEFTRLTQTTVFHNLCRDHHEITAITENEQSKKTQEFHMHKKERADETSPPQGEGGTRNHPHKKSGTNSTRKEGGESSRREHHFTSLHFTFRLSDIIESVHTLE